MQNKKGLALIGITLTVGIMIVVAVIIAILMIGAGIFINFVIHNIFLILGSVIVIFGLTYLLRSQHKDKMKHFLVILLIGFVLVISSFVFGFTSQSSIGGASILSVSNVDYDGVSKVRVYGTATGAEQLSITFNPSILNPYLLSDGVAATKSVIGSITLDKQLKRFPLVKSYDEVFYDVTVRETGLLQKCESLTPPIGYAYSYYVLSNSKLCFFIKPIGINAKFNGQGIRDSLVSFNIGGAVGVLQPSAGVNVITLNDGQTSVEWTGDLSNYNQVNAPTGTYSALFYESVYKKLIKGTSYSSSQTELNTLKDTRYGATSGLAKAQEAVNRYNYNVQNLLIDKTTEYKNSINIDNMYFTENALEVDLKVADAFPTFIITLDASKVGIISLKGKPDITKCVDTLLLNSGDTTNPTLTVKNIGTNDGSFYGNVLCSGTATVSGIISETYFAKGEEKSIPITITGSNTVIDTTKSASCTITITDRKGGGSDTCTFSADVKYESGTICIPGEGTCFNTKILKVCSADGKSSNEIECKYGCIIEQDTGINKCGGYTNQTSECKWYQESYQSQTKVCTILGLFNCKEEPVAGCKTSGVVYALVGVGGIIILGTAIAFIYKPKKDKHKSKRRR